LVSKRNRDRKTAEKIAKPAEKPAEKIAKPAEINVEQILTAVTQKVVEVLKPDLEQKVTAVQTSLSNQIKAEMQDLREHLPSLPQQPIEQPDLPTTAIPDPLSQTSQTPPQPQSQNQQLVSSLLPLFAQVLKPNNSNNELMSMFMQTAMRKEMSKATMSDWLQEAVMKKFANEFLQTDYPSDVESATKHFMKPIRDIGVRAEQAKQQSENKQ